MLLKQIVEDNLEEDEEEDDGEVSLSEERALRRRLTRHSTPQGVDGPVNVFLGLPDGLDGTLEFTQICSLLPDAAAVFVFVPLAA